MYMPGKHLCIPDALSRAPLPCLDDTTDLQVPTEAFISNIVSTLPATPNRIEQLRAAQAQDKTLSQVIHCCQEGWPEKKLKGPIKKFWMARNDHSLHDNLLLCGSRIVIPRELRHEILHKLHNGHQGIVKCRLRARESVWWPGISEDINTCIHNCDTCCRDFPIATQPMIPTKLPERPCEKVASDLFELKGTPYIVIVDYFSCYIEILKLTTTTSSSIIVGMKSIFCRYGILMWL